jgi:hypothetical protein
MLAIVRVTRTQLDELYWKLEKQNRHIMPEFMVGHVYVSPSNVLYICDQDTEFFQFPADKELSVAETIRCMTAERIKREG